MNVIVPMGYSMAMWSIDSNGTTGNASYLAKIMANATNGTIAQTIADGPVLPGEESPLTE